MEHVVEEMNPNSTGGVDLHRGVISSLTNVPGCIRENAAKQSHKRQALAFWSGKTLPIAFQAWCAFATRKAEATAKASRALGFWGNKALAEALTAWKAFVVERQQLRTKMQQAAGFWMRCSLRSAFYGWLDGAARSQEKQLALRKAAGFFTNRFAVLPVGRGNSASRIALKIPPKTLTVPEAVKRQLAACNTKFTKQMRSNVTTTTCIRQVLVSALWLVYHTTLLLALQHSAGVVISLCCLLSSGAPNHSVA